MTGFIKEFREFAIKGNMVDMAVGIIIGAAFGKIVSSIVGDVMMPLLGLVIGGVDFTGLTITLRAATAETPALTLNYGNFLQTTIDFLIIAFAIFMVVKGINTLKRSAESKAAEVPPAPTKDQVLLTEIRDILKAK